MNQKSIRIRVVERDEIDLDKLALALLSLVEQLSQTVDESVATGSDEVAS